MQGSECGRRVDGRRPPSKPANEVTTGSSAAKTAIPVDPNPETSLIKGKAKAETAKPADEVTTGFDVDLSSLEGKSPKADPIFEFLRSIP